MNFLARPSRLASLFTSVFGAFITAAGVYFLFASVAASTFALIFLVAFVVAGVFITAYHAYNAATGKAFALFTGESEGQSEHKPDVAQQ
jgi:uncharacterized membrane protein